MRIFLTLSLLVLIGSAIWAPLHFKAREPQIDVSPLRDKTPRERAAEAEKARSLGPAIMAYRDILKESPNDVDAIKGYFAASVRLGAAVPRQPDIAEVLHEAANGYLKALPAIDPDGSFLQDLLTEWVDIRMGHEWYLARASISMWMNSRGDARSYEMLRELMGLGPFWRDYYSYCQRYMPNWHGVERFVREDLEKGDVELRVYAGVTLLTYNRIYGVGEELLKKHRRSIRDAVIEAKAAMEPDIHDNSAGTPGGQTILGLAALDDPDTRRILARMRSIDHPYLSRVLENARFWAGIDPWEKADFESRAYEHWYPSDQEIYFRGVMLRYADVLRRARAETDPKKKAKLVERVKKLSVLVETATYFGMTSVKIFARRAKAALFPAESDALHREMIEQGGVDSIYGVMSLPQAERVSTLVLAMTAREPDTSALAVSGLIKVDGPVPIQMPIPTE